MLTRMTKQQYILLGSLIVILGGMVLLFSTPSQEVEDSVQENSAQFVLVDRAPEGYRMSEWMPITNKFTNVSADRLYLTNTRQQARDAVNGTTVVLSPDSQWKLVKRRYTDDIYIVSTSDTQEKRVLREREYIEGVSKTSIDYATWSWDSKEVFYRITRQFSAFNKNTEMWFESVDIATGVITRHPEITSAKEMHTFLAVQNPTNEPILYHDADSNTLFARTKDNTKHWVIARGADRLGSRSPDKRKVLISAEDTWRIYATDGSGLLDEFEAPSRTPIVQWSPDNTKLLYWVYRGDGHRAGEIDIYIMNSDGTGRTQLTTVPESRSGPKWLNNGESIIFSLPGENPVFRLRSDTYYVADLATR